jgi:acyl-CoA synthetase (NDP forming)
MLRPVAAVSGASFGVPERANIENPVAFCRDIREAAVERRVDASSIPATEIDIAGVMSLPFFNGPVPSDVLPDTFTLPFFCFIHGNAWKNIGVWMLMNQSRILPNEMLTTIKSG